MQTGCRNGRSISLKTLNSRHLYDLNLKRLRIPLQAVDRKGSPVFRIEPESARRGCSKQNELCCVATSADDVRKYELQSRGCKGIVARGSGGDQKIAALVVLASQAGQADGTVRRHFDQSPE